MRVLSIDPAIRNTGYAVVEGEVRRPRALDYGTLKLPDRLDQAQCLLRIHEHVEALIARWKPDVFAIESIIYVQSMRTAITMGSARAASVIAAAKHGLEISEFSPTSVKLAVVGRGQASKDQVAFMVRALLGLEETPASDAADALAIGIARLSGRPSTK